jgi:putative ABC transport system permease protein
MAHPTAALRFAARNLIRSPGFSTAVVATLGLGIGAGSALFSVVYAVLLRPLPYPSPDRLVMLQETDESGGESDVAPGNFLAWSARATDLFTDLASFHSATTTIHADDGPERIFVVAATPSLFSVLGVRPGLGRWFTAEEAAAGAPGVVVLSDGFWQTGFGADPKVLGTALRLGDKSYTVIGVAPPHFGLPSAHTKLWVPLAFAPRDAANRGDHYLQVVGRLREGIGVAQGRLRLFERVRAIAADHPGPSPAGVRLVPLRDHLLGDFGTTIDLLVAAVVLAFLVSGFNLGLLLLARSVSRQQELAVRVCFGARPTDLARELALERLILALVGAAGGWLIATWTVRAVAAAGAAEIPRASEIHLGGATLVFTTGMGLAAWLLLGLVPLVMVVRATPRDWLREGGALPGRQRVRFGRLLVVSEVAVAFPLVIGAAILAQTVTRLQRVDPGFDPRHALAVELSVPGSRYPPEEAVAFYQRLLERCAGLPAVRSVGATSSLPLTGSAATVRLTADGGSALAGRPLAVAYRVVDPGYFDALRIPILEGRPFGDADGAEAPRVAIVNRELARQLWPGGSPVGKRLHLGADRPAPEWTVVGMAGEVRQAGLEAEPLPEVLVPLPQDPWWPMTLVFRTEGNPLDIAGAVRSEVRRLDDAIPVASITTLEQIRDRSMARRRFLAQVLFGFALLALALAVIGIYGLTAYSVGRRRRELGVRMAMGSDRPSVVWLVMKEGMLLAVAGIALGLAAAPGLERLLGSFLYGVTALDARLLAILGAFVLVVALTACLLPAVRASRLDPAAALRAD